MATGTVWTTSSKTSSPTRNLFPQWTSKHAQRLLKDGNTPFAKPVATRHFNKCKKFGTSPNFFQFPHPVVRKMSVFPPQTNVQQNTHNFSLLTHHFSLFSHPVVRKLGVFHRQPTFQQNTHNFSLLAHHFSLFPTPWCKKRNSISNFAQKKACRCMPFLFLFVYLLWSAIHAHKLA